MNKFAVITLLFSVFFAGSVFAADAKPVKASTGTVVSYTPADAGKNTPATLVVKVGTKDETFLFDAKTVVQGKDKKAVDVSALKAGVKVTVKFTSDKKILTAVTVTLK